MIVVRVMAAIMLFLLGFLIALVIQEYAPGYLYLDFSEPLSFSKENGNISPSDYVSERDIEIYSDRIVINVDGASIGRYAPTGSMVPVLDYGTNGIRIVPNDPDQIGVGDIVTYRRDGKLIVHRVVEKGVDEIGDYFILKGDNNSVSDGKVRFEEFEYLTIGLLY